MNSIKQIIKNLPITLKSIVIIFVLLGTYYIGSLFVGFFIFGPKPVPVQKQFFDKYFKANITDSVTNKRYFQDSYNKTDISFCFNNSIKILILEVEKSKNEVNRIVANRFLNGETSDLTPFGFYYNLLFDNNDVSFDILNNIYHNSSKYNVIESCSEIDSSFINNGVQILFVTFKSDYFICANDENVALIKIQNKNNANSAFIVVNSPDKYRFYFIRFAVNSDCDSVFNTIYHNNISPVLKTEFDLQN